MVRTWGQHSRAYLDHSPYFGAAGPLLAIILIACSGVNALVFLMVSVVGVITKDKDRRETCLKLAEMSKGCSWPPGCQADSYKEKLRH